MHLGDLASADLALDPGARAIEIGGLSSDSRAVGRGFLFAALTGSTTDGARYIGDAISHGAAALLVDRKTAVPASAGCR